MSRDPWGLLPLSTPSPGTTSTQSTSSQAPSKTASVRADRRAALGRLAVRRGGLVGVAAGIAGFYVGDVPSCFDTRQRALAYVSALPVCAVLSGLCGLGCASVAVAVLPRRRHRRLALGISVLGAMGVYHFVCTWRPLCPTTKSACGNNKQAPRGAPE
ncbi:hypothetical protein psal_cds_338 [Pandoravirus salinus]|uniref:Transmembrane protein n=1 Tax=Pandoravirus salinus TaxID=1349410 RepID=A0A291ATF7_9VIRU|nr:hypothetical protein psal_cds_338 [Pandoravirus salinus]ATE82160.1 hypothetical protein psal_cds_338 [Pandoravirus salinus]